MVRMQPRSPGVALTTVIALGILGLVIALAAPATAGLPEPPGWPQYYQGTVSSADAAMQQGTRVVARVDGATKEWATTVDDQGRFGYTPPFYVEADNPNTAEKDGARNGDTVYFYVRDGDSDQETLAGTATFESGGPTLVLELVAPSATVTATVTPEGAGIISPAGSFVAQFGSSYTFTITPTVGFEIADLSVNGVSDLANVSIDPKTGVGTYVLQHVVADTEVVASFAETVYRLYLPLVMR